jgi:hypothetical protein
MFANLRARWHAMSKRQQARAWGWAVLAPFVYVLFLIPLLSTIESIFPLWQLARTWWYRLFNLPLLVWFILMLVAFFTHLRNNPAIDEEQRPLWRFLLLIGNFYTMAYYWYRYIRPDLKEAVGE